MISGHKATTSGIGLHGRARRRPAQTDIESENLARRRCSHVGEDLVVSTVVIVLGLRASRRSTCRSTEISASGTTSASRRERASGNHRGRASDGNHTGKHRGTPGFCGAGDQKRGQACSGKTGNLTGRRRTRHNIASGTDSRRDREHTRSRTRRHRETRRHRARRRENTPGPTWVQHHGGTKSKNSSHCWSQLRLKAEKDGR